MTLRLHPNQLALADVLYETGQRVFINPDHTTGVGWRESAAHAMARIPVWLVVAPRVLHRMWQDRLKDAGAHGAMLTTPEYYRAHRGDWNHDGLNVLFDLPPMGPVMRDAMLYAAHHAARVWMRTVSPSAARYVPGILLHGGKACSFVRFDGLMANPSQAVSVTEVTK
jgi:hypothetical protein